MQRKKTYLSHIVFLWLTQTVFADPTPLFIISPMIHGPTQLVAGQIGTAVYQVTNSTPYHLSHLNISNLGEGVTVVNNAGVDYCDFPLSLNTNQTCLMKLRINSASLAQNTIQNRPKICFSETKPIYCSQTLADDALNIPVALGPAATTCEENVANFHYELEATMDSASFDTYWGPIPNILALSPADPDLTQCVATIGATWQQNRLLAAADFWINQKLNYCHHYLPDWISPPALRQRASNQGGYCSSAIDIAPNTRYYNQAVRWNYSGNGSETAANWLNNQYKWRGLDCSNYTAFLYNFALSITFTGEVGWQAGQRADNSQVELSPNQQTPGNELDNPSAAGVLVCSDNTLEVAHSCAGHGDYISVIASDGSRKPLPAVSDAELAALHPGDLIYIAANLTNGEMTPEVTHVVMWTGKKIGYGVNDIPPNKIAPNSICPNNWQPQIGEWVITDSHYQGADYRMFTNCFYRNNIWGVRRIEVK